MSVLVKLASVLGQRDEQSNYELACELVADKNRNGIAELVDNLTNKNKGIQNDCIKTLYEVGTQEPELIAAYAPTFIKLLQHKNNRLVWGAMTALSSITAITSDLIYKHLPELLAAANGDSVIAKDHYVRILTILAANKKYTDDAITLLQDVIKDCPVNQLPSYAESAGSIITESHKAALKEVLTTRLKDVEQESKRKRLEKVIKKL